MKYKSPSISTVEWETTETWFGMIKEDSIWAVSMLEKAIKESPQIFKEEDFEEYPYFLDLWKVHNREESIKSLIDDK